MTSGSNRPPESTQTKSQVNRLGDRLRVGPITDELLAQLQEFRSRYAAPMLAVQSTIAEKLGLEATARLKTVNATVEKLRREKTRLSQMQDIGGVRLVGDWTLREQDDVVSQIISLFPGARIHDRRARPTFGYRAVHVVAVVDGCTIEIQVRSLEQNAWAQSVEKLADIIGREIRYGGGPEEYRSAIGLITKDISEAIAKYEIGRDLLHEGRRVVALAEKVLADDSAPTPEAKADLRKRLEDLNLPERERRERLMADVVRRMLAAMDDLSAKLTGGSNE